MPVLQRMNISTFTHVIAIDNLDWYVWICKEGLQYRIQTSVASRTEGNSIRKVAQEAGVDERRVREWEKARD